MRRLLPLAMAALLVAGPTGAVSSRPVVCATRLLVLSAFPGEIDKLLFETRVTDSAVVDGHTFYVGTLRGNAVVLALTGIGLVNAEDTARTALGTFRCGSGTAVSGIVFSGVAGGKSFIGDVTVPSRWTLDDGKTWYPTDGRMFAVARAVIERGGVSLADRTPLGDLACVGLDPGLIATVQMPQSPQIIVGGDGKSADPFGGRAFPCIPGGGDVFGCQPCRAPLQAPDVARFVDGAAPFVDPDFFLGYFEMPTPSTTEWVAEDMETAAVARVAAEHRIPFLAFRAMSDGQGDPLMLPGFPFQFFVYRQLAADNAATVALAFLQVWAGR
jgi:nucleoside phosphorylase